MVVKQLDNKDIWDRHIGESAYGTLFHSWDFLKITERHSGYRLYPYGVYRGDELVCLFPLFARSSMGRTALASPPPNLPIPHLGFVMGPVYDKIRQRKKESYLNGVMDEMEAEIKSLHPGSVNISTVNGFVDMRPFKWNGYQVQMRYSYAVDLQPPLEELLGRFDRRLRQEIEGAEKLPLSIAPADDVGAFYDALASLYRRHGLGRSLPDPAFLKDALAAFPDNLKLCFLRKGEEIVSPIAYYQFKNRFSFWLGWGLADSHLQYDAYAAWSLIRSKQAEGLTTLEVPASGRKQLCFFSSMFNAPIEYSFSIRKNDLLGSLAGSVNHGFAVS